MLNKIILSLLSNKVEKSQSLEVKSMQADDLEKPSSYKGWVYPVRYLLAMRYMKVKQKTLDWFRANKVYPVPEDEFRQALVHQLSSKKQKSQPNPSPVKSPFLAFGMKSGVLYPVLIAALLFGLWSVNSWYQQRRVENVLANHLPYYSDLIHQKLLLRDAGRPSLIEKLNEKITQEQQKILSDLPEKGNIKSLMEEQLNLLKDSSASIKDVLMGFKTVNIALDKERVPFYLSPKSFSLPCSSFINVSVEEMLMLKKMESLLSGGKPEYCRTTIMTTYKVKERKQLYYAEGKGKDKTELPLFLSTRVDKVPAVDSALGLTFQETGIGSLILLDRIKRFTTESVLPALTFQGRSYVIPYWMQGYYDIEESVTKSYKKDLRKVYHDKAEFLEVKKAVKQLLRNKSSLSNSRLQQTLQRNNTNSDNNSVFSNGLDAISVLLGKESKLKKDQTKEPVVIPNLSKLDDVILPSIEYHEAYHQIVKDDWSTPAWQKTLFKDLSENSIDHNMEELGAYLSQLANTEDGQNIWLSKLLIFSLNPMTKGQAEYYASSLIFTSMKSLYQGQAITPRFDADVDEKTEIFKVLTALPQDEVRKYARQAYETLFEREVPNLKY